MKKCVRFLLCILTLCVLTAALCACGFSTVAQELGNYWLYGPQTTTPSPSLRENPTTPPLPTAQTPSTEPVTPPVTVNIAGDYIVHSMQANGLTLSKDMIDQALKYYGTDSNDILQLALRSDGTGFLQAYNPETNEEISAELGWDANHLWPLEEPTDRLAYSYSNNQITLTVEDITVVLQKTVLSL